MGVTEAIVFLREQVAPVANRLDHDSDALAEALRGLGACGALALKRPEAFGGPQLAEREFRTFQEEVARASGALAFLQTQHQSAVGLIAKGSNETLKAETLPHTHNGDRLIGIGFSQLRRAGEPLLRATEESGGYKIEGHIPWVTGLGFFAEALIGAQLADGRAVFGLIPFEKRPGLSFSAPMRLAAMESARTVTADLVNWWMPMDKVVDVKPAGWILRNDRINITLQGFFALGCARGGVDVIEQEFSKRQISAMRNAADALSQEINACRDQLFVAQEACEDTTEEKLQLRAWAIDLAVRCAHAAVASAGGAANSADHPAQRLYREALVYTVSAQTPGIQAATLERLTRAENALGTTKPPPTFLS